MKEPYFQLSQQVWLLRVFAKDVLMMMQMNCLVEWIFEHTKEEAGD